MDIVFANTTATVSVGPGNHTTVHEGEHWPASDQVVRSHPSLFTNDPRYGLRVSAPLDEDANDEPEAPVIDDEWAVTVQALKDAGHTPETAAALAQGGGDTNASKSQAPVEQATKAPGEKRTTRRG